MIFISLPPLRFIFYYSLLLSAYDNAQGVPEHCVLIFQGVAMCGAVLLLHEGRKLILRKEGPGAENSLKKVYCKTYEKHEEGH